MLIVFPGETLADTRTCVREDISEFEEQAFPLRTLKKQGKLLIGLPILLETAEACLRFHGSPPERKTSFSLHLQPAEQVYRIYGLALHRKRGDAPKL